MLTQTKKQAIDLTKKIARQVAQEPLEILKAAGGQLSGEQMDYYKQRLEKDGSAGTNENKTQQLKDKDKVQSSRTLEALDRELKDIHRDKLFKELQQKIAAGQKISVQDFGELTVEQKQVLQAQMEAVKVQRQQQALVGDGGLVEPKSKRARGSWMFGNKSSAEKQQTRVEKPLPPSG